MQQGWQLDKVFVERAVSGARPLDERKEGAALLAALKPGDTIICPRLDRMFRSALDALGISFGPNITRRAPKPPPTSRCGGTLSERSSTSSAPTAGRSAPIA